MSDQAKQAFITSLRLLTATSKSRKGLAQKLGERGFPQTVIEETLDRLEKQGLLNDRSVASSLLQSFRYHRISGRKRIAFEMEKHGIEDSLIEELLQKYSPEEEREKALELGIISKNNTLMYALIVVILIILWIAWRSFRKRQRLKRSKELAARR